MGTTTERHRRAAVILKEARLERTPIGELPAAYRPRDDMIVFPTEPLRPSQLFSSSPHRVHTGKLKLADH